MRELWDEIVSLMAEGKSYEDAVKLVIEDLAAEQASDDIELQGDLDFNQVKQNYISKYTKEWEDMEKEFSSSEKFKYFRESSGTNTLKAFIEKQKEEEKKQKELQSLVENGQAFDEIEVRAIRKMYFQKERITPALAYHQASEEYFEENLINCRRANTNDPDEILILDELENLDYNYSITDLDEIIDKYPLKKEYIMAYDQDRKFLKNFYNTRKQWEFTETNETNTYFDLLYKKLKDKTDELIKQFKTGDDFKDDTKFLEQFNSNIPVIFPSNLSINCRN